MVFDHLSLTLGKKEILKELSFSLRRGRLTALIGRNGSGKSSLLGCINRQYRYEGKITLEGLSLSQYSPKEQAQRIALLPQLLPSPQRTVRSLCAMGRSPHLGLSGRLSAEDHQKIEQALEQTLPKELWERPLSTLSGGERQRAFLAMILAQDTPILLLDEPTTYMDMSAAAEFSALLRELTRSGQKTILAAIHDLNTAITYADNLLLLDQGRLLYAGSTADCLETDLIERTFKVRRETYGENQAFFH